MRKHANVLFILLIVAMATWIFTKCRKEELVIVYSKVSTVRAYSTTSTTTAVEGSIDSLTSAAHDEFGFCLDTLANPTVYIQKLLTTGIVQLGTFSGNITGLKPAKTYHVRAFIKDNKKYLYGRDVSFTTTAAILPVVTSTSVTGITSKYAVSGGNVTAEGDKPVIAKGVCYDTVASPTILKNKTLDGWGTGSFTSNLNNLVPSKTYYVRAYATSVFGVSYGSQVTFTTGSKVFSFQEEFSNNSNSWYTGTETYGSVSVTNGLYVVSYNQTGYLWRVCNNFPEFITMSNTKDFEINLRIRNSWYDFSISTTNLEGGLVWDNGTSGFKYFGINRNYTNVFSGASTYYYTIGSYNGSYTVWKTSTQFTGSDYNKLTIKKGSGYYYFFINDVQVHKQSYTNITNDGVGFYVQNSSINADYLYIDQKGDKKSADIEITELKSLPGGPSITRSFRNK